MRIALRLLAKVASCLGLLQLVACASVNRSATPLHVQSFPLHGTPTSTIKNTLQMLFGAEPTIGGIDAVTILDSDSFGESYSSDLVQVEVPEVQIQRENQTTVLHMFLVFESSTGKLLLAYTSPSEQFLKSPPAKNAGETEEGFQSESHKVEALHTFKLKSTLPAMLSSFWQKTGLDPSKAGQVIVRPRSIDNDWPGSEEFLGRRIPTPGIKPWWIIHLLGCPPSLVGVSHWEWATQHLWAFSDDDPETGFGTYRR